ncbi:putative NSF attachment protein [Rosa chinensis]|uniref:Putative NSF attachment protein n=2 Tax=Rosa chinensis TaxID=74649 RepID=A0A2P6PWM9_ROSCH|nr:putative NSF attachment protein [Rosa chinensis]
MHFFEKAAELFQNKELTVSANQCYQKAAQLAAQIEQYSMAIEIFKKIATRSLSHSLLMDEAQRHLFNAGICRLCQGDDVVAMDMSVMRYVDMYPIFLIHGRLGVQILDLH